jgi:predicted ATP-dependent endonuclease of OLD family
LWIDPTRANAFLSEKVILIEGPTEKALFSFLFNHPKGAFYNDGRTAKVTIVDTVGKYHQYKFSHLLNMFGVKVWCLYDGDNDKCNHGISHKILNEGIEGLKTDGIIRDCMRLDPSLEQYLGVEKSEGSQDINMYICLEQNKNGCLDSKNYSDLVDYVKRVIEA